MIREIINIFIFAEIKINQIYNFWHQTIMDQQIQKLQRIISEDFNKSKEHILNKYGNPDKKSDSHVWFFRKFYFSPYNDEIAIIFDENIVVDICLTHYFLWWEIKNIYYFEGGTPDYKVVNN